MCLLLLLVISTQSACYVDIKIHYDYILLLPNPAPKNKHLMTLKIDNLFFLSYRKQFFIVRARSH